jgi:hypothetical protein
MSWILPVCKFEPAGLIPRSYAQDPVARLNRHPVPRCTCTYLHPLFRQRQQKRINGRFGEKNAGPQRRILARRVLCFTLHSSTPSRCRWAVPLFPGQDTTWHMRLIGCPNVLLG